MSNGERTAQAAELSVAVERIANEVARSAAVDVDARARFPSETIDALRQARVLSAAVPAELGGAGASVPELARMCTLLAQQCASSAMVLAMHHIQVLSIANHAADKSQLLDYLRGLVREQRLIASVTSEVGPSGDMRRSVAAVQAHAERFELVKQATTVSYGQHADDLLISARRDPAAAPSDQVLVLAPRGSYKLSDIGGWDTLGMRGTCSPGAKVHVDGASWQVLPVPFGQIASYTMVPTSHILWSAVWLGIATDAVGKAQTMVRAKARAEPGVLPRPALRVAEVVRKLQIMRDQVSTLAREYDELTAARDSERLASLAFALRINNLKLNASTVVVEIAAEALGICGIAAYKNDSPFSLGRHLRDAYSAALMINNDRIQETNASLLLVHKGN
jgi:acyl-CoA dehydrogenase